MVAIMEAVTIKLQSAVNLSMNLTDLTGFYKKAVVNESFTVQVLLLYGIFSSYLMLHSVTKRLSTAFVEI